VKTLANPKFLLVFVLILFAVATPIPRVYSSTLTLTVFTTEPSYKIGEDIIVYGSLKYNDSPVPLWPVAIEIQDPIGTPVVTRSLQTDVSGVYILTFKLPTNAELGTYTAYVSSGYKGETDTNNTTFELIPIRDIAVTNVTSSKTVVGQGYSVNITVIVDNQGELTETFNVTVYANTTSIASQNVTLTSGNSTTLTFTWNTTGFAYAYTISANATILPGETDTSDNTFVDGLIKVSCVGDLNGDYITDGQDYQLVKNAIPSSPGSPKWNPNADLNDDGLVDGQDFQIVKKNIGQSAP